ncbi:hypothetical protein EGW08_007913 [Elysia chlorotica]|uniref:FAM124 domain-containing protein n=1 Tax=Elysia chlorotica TaxID=188477 RepID=A0A3S0ZRR8_ELYCH|nr:hypothetical protein EGW08_007913 [Elysia chlorotica]
MDDKKGNSGSPTLSLVKGDRGDKPSKAGVCLTLVVPPGKRKYMCRILKPIVRDIRGLGLLLDVTERADNHIQPEDHQGLSTPSYTVSSQELSAPALAVMLFLPEHSHNAPDAEAVRGKFREFPWRYHHAIQLQSAAATNPSLLGQQDFYFLSRQLPLWSVSAGIHQTGARVRFNIFARRFDAMVEFYRLVTDSEMESRKAGFCVFPLKQGHPYGDSAPPTSRDKASANSVTCELALKHCPMVNPFPLSDAHLSFPVRNLASLLNVLPTQARCLSSNRYLIHDPDGNSLILFDTEYHRPADSGPATATRLVPETIDHSCSRVAMVDKSSEQEFSIDSGRYSDFETSSFELETCMSKMVEEVDLLKLGSYRHGRDSRIISRDCAIEPSERFGQGFSKLGRQENNIQKSLPSHRNVHYHEIPISDQRCTKRRVGQMCLCNKEKITCNNLKERVIKSESQTDASIYRTFNCDRGCERSEKYLLCDKLHANSPNQRCCRSHTCGENVLSTDTSLDSKWDYSETDL